MGPMPDLPSRLRPAARTGRRHWPLLISAGSVALPIAISLGACGGRGLPLAAAPPAPFASEAPIAAQSATPAGPASSTSAPNVTASSPPAPPPNPGSLKATAKVEPNWAACHRHYEARDKEVSRDVASMAKACAKVTKMRLVGATLSGKQGDQDAPQTFPLKAEANHCYRVYAEAGEGIKDLNLAIKDSTGAIAGEDSTDDTRPVILEDGAVCFKEADAASVVVSVGMGKGAYALQIWAD
jgi:hypothetical protein